LKIAAFRDLARRRMWKMLLECGHVQYELFSEHPREIKRVPYCRCCVATERIARVRARSDEILKQHRKELANKEEQMSLF